MFIKMLWHNSGADNLVAPSHWQKFSAVLWHDWTLCFVPCREILANSGQFKYLHSAVIMGGLMLVFGGNTHNDTLHSQGAKCYSTDFMAYDLGE